MLENEYLFKIDSQNLRILKNCFLKDQVLNLIYYKL